MVSRTWIRDRTTGSARVQARLSAPLARPPHGTGYLSRPSPQLCSRDLPVPRAEDCTTELRIDTWTAPVKEADWDGAWKQLERLPHPHDGTVQEVMVGAVQYTYRHPTVNVAELVSESAVKAKLLQPLEERLSTRA